jgi:hypothetical protein
MTVKDIVIIVNYIIENEEGSEEEWIVDVFVCVFTFCRWHFLFECWLWF